MAAAMEVFLSFCRKTPSWPPLPANSALRPAPHVCGQTLRFAGAWLRVSWLSAISGASRPAASLFCGQTLRFAGAWLRASWLSAISGASRPSASLGCGLRVCGTAARCPQPSVLRTLLAARSTLSARCGLRTAVALRAVLALGAAHPF